MNHNFVTLANEADASKHLTWLVGPADAAKMPTVVTFDQAGNGYYLKTVQMGDKITPNPRPAFEAGNQRNHIDRRAVRRISPARGNADWRDFQAGSLRAKGAFGTTDRSAS